MATRTQAQYDRQKARRQQRKLEAMDISTFHWKTCDWCGTRWNPNKVPVWLGKKTCPNCEDFARRTLHSLLALKIVRLKKHSKLPRARSVTNWGHLGTFDPTRPWMKWGKCAFCTIPQCLNNNDAHQVRYRTWKGHQICGKCTRTIKVMLPQLKEMGYLKMRKKKQ